MGRDNQKDIDYFDGFTWLLSGIDFDRNGLGEDFVVFLLLQFLHAHSSDESQHTQKDIDCARSGYWYILISFATLSLECLRVDIPERLRPCLTLQYNQLTAGISLVKIG